MLMGGETGVVRSSLLHVLGNPSRALPRLPTAFTHPFHIDPEVTILPSGTHRAEETSHEPIVPPLSRPPTALLRHPLGSKLFKQIIYKNRII